MRRFESREARFSARALMAYAAPSLPETLTVVAAAEGADAEILLYDEIGYWGTNATDFAQALSEAGDGPLTLRINSPGGDVFDGYAIYNMLRNRAAPVHVVIDGLAASAASFIAMAGKTVTMGEPSMLMIHNSWGMCVGDRNDMLDMAAMQEKIDGQIAAIYAVKSGQTVDQMAAAMDAESWYTSSEAKAIGLCDAVISQDPDGASNQARAVVKDTSRGRARPMREASHQARAGVRDAATTPEWIAGGATDLPIDDTTAWDGPTAAERMLDEAGFNGPSPDPAKAKLGFLAWDHHNPKLKGSYKLPFADLVDGKLTALKSGLDAAAARLPDTDIPDTVKSAARAVIDAYTKRMKPDDDGDDAAQALRRQRLNRLRLAEAEEA